MTQGRGESHCSPVCAWLLIPGGEPPCGSPRPTRTPGWCSWHRAPRGSGIGSGKLGVGSWGLGEP